MNTQELIKQAEEVLSECKSLNYDTEIKLAVFARNHLPEIIKKLNKYGDALDYIANADLPAIRCVEAAKKALEE